MNRSKKVISMALVASMMVGTCSCSAKFENSVMDKADDLGKFIVERNYKKIEKMAADKDKELEAVLTLETDSFPEDNDAREIIADTLTYEVDEDSFEGDFFGKEGSIDIVFTYVDYEKAIDDIAIFEGIDSFEAAIEDCDDVVELTITFEFEKIDGECVCTNIDEIKDIFPYATEDFNWALSRDNYIGEVEFIGLGSNDFYLDATAISCELPITGDGQELEWNYYYMIECDGIFLLTSEVMSSDGTSLTADYSYFGDPLFGEYTFTFYLADDTYLASGTIMADLTEEEPEPEPAPVEGSYVGPYYIAPADGVIAFPETNLVLSLPYGQICIPGDSPALESLSSTNPMVAQLMLFFSVNPIDNSGAFAMYIPFVAYDSPEAINSFNQAVEEYSVEGVTTETTNTEFTVGDYTYTVSNITATAADGTVTYLHFALVGDEDSCAVVYFFSEGVDNYDVFIAGFSMN